MTILKALFITTLTVLIFLTTASYDNTVYDDIDREIAEEPVCELINETEYGVDKNNREVERRQFIHCDDFITN